MKRVILGLVMLALLLVVAFAQPLLKPMRDRADRECSRLMDYLAVSSYETQWQLGPYPHWRCHDLEGSGKSVDIGWWP